MMIFVLGIGCAAADPPPPTAVAASVPERIVAVGDLHADLPQALSVLQLAGIVDETGKWSGVKRPLVKGRSHPNT